MHVTRDRRARRWLTATLTATALLGTEKARAVLPPPAIVEAAAPAKIPPGPNDVRLTAHGRIDTLPFSEVDVMTSHGFSEAGTKLKNQLYFLKASIVGTSVEKRRVREHCRRGPKAFSLDAQGLGCAFIELERQRANEKEEQPSTKKGSAKKKKRTGPIRNSTDWEQTADWTYNQALSRLNPKTIEDGKLLATLALEGGCKTSVAGAALLNQLEDFLPDEEAWKNIDAIYAKISDCVNPQSAAHEQLHLRMGLLNILRDNKRDATQALNRALQAQSTPEEFRTLFWRGFLESKIKPNKPIVVKWNPFWDRLVKAYPLTQHAVLVHALFDEHPVPNEHEENSLALTPYSGEKWDSANLTNFLFLNLLTRKDMRTAKELSRQVEGRVQASAIGPGLLMAHAHLATGNLRESMRVTYSAMKDAGADAIYPDAIKMLYPVLYVKEVERHAQELEVAFVLSLMRQESSFNKRAESPRGAVGLMQVLPDTARGVTSKRKRNREQNLFDPDANIAAGCKYLARQLANFDENEVLTLAAYNAGPTNANRWIKRYPGASPLLLADLIPFPETRAYVSGILRGRFWYRYLTGAFDKEQQQQNEMLYAEHLLANRIEPNLASRKEKFRDLTMLARPLFTGPALDEVIYNESF